MKLNSLTALAAIVIGSLGVFAAGQPDWPYQADHEWEQCWCDVLDEDGNPVLDENGIPLQEACGWRLVTQEYVEGFPVDDDGCYTVEWLTQVADDSFVPIDPAVCYDPKPEVNGALLTQTCGPIDQVCTVVVKGGRNHAELTELWDQSNCGAPMYLASMADSGLRVGGKNKDKNIPEMSYVAIGGCEVLPHDEDCDGWPDEVDCSPLDPAINPGAPEICGDGLDNDCDGLVDDEDPDCQPQP